MSSSLSLFNFVVSDAVPTSLEINAELLLLSPRNTVEKKKKKTELDFPDIKSTFLNFVMNAHEFTMPSSLG